MSALTVKEQFDSYSLGWEAAEGGLTLDDNPYEPDRELDAHMYWRQGYRDGRSKTAGQP